MSIISSDEILAFMMYVDNAKNDNVVEVFFEFAYEVQIQIYNLLRNRHSYLTYLDVFFAKTKCKAIPTWDHCPQPNTDKTNVIAVVDPAIQE